jgi:hypothetical protein
MCSFRLMHSHDACPVVAVRFYLISLVGVCGRLRRPQKTLFLGLSLKALKPAAA